MRAKAITLLLKATGRDAIAEKQTARRYVARGQCVPWDSAGSALLLKATGRGMVGQKRIARKRASERFATSNCANGVRRSNHPIIDA